MEKKIVQGANKESSASGPNEAGAAPVQDGGEAPPGGVADLTFKAKRERHKQLKNKKMLK